MNNNELAHRFSTLPACALAAAFFFVTTAASAQTVSSNPAQGGTSSTTAPAADPAAAAAKPAMEAPAVVAEEEETYSLPLQVGDATSNLFAWQRSGEIASNTPRPIAGSVASRSYERYLKSFEHPIPEHMSSTVKTSTGGGSK
ncbi:DUF3613 domain-containing protein [Variovorax paradoxus]|uniref:DUF3613 domain-containing protein n=1 Tax=Variovorax paradoxus TaxID=34073 RepID=A0A5Q0M1E4_VARPD|nr:DUF3613 domain-containing protein [Variovorax paradoxus]QFZ83381.1 DUF3613 domain-containing protein [Variovorax paradoxus]